MQKIRSVIAIVGIVGLASPAAIALAQQTAPSTGAPATSTQSPASMANTPSPAPNAPAPAANTANNEGPSGTLEKVNNDWRSSRLVGATVYDDGGASIGTVNDLLIGDDGKVDAAVVSVGGFLGIGSKLVSIPFDQIKFVESATHHGSAANPSSDASNNTASTNAPAGQGAAPTATSSNPTYYSMVLMNASKDSLTKLPDFEYNNS